MALAITIVRSVKGSAMTPAPTTILVPTDFSPTSKEALEYGRMLAERFGASLHLVHVCEQPAMSAAWSEGYSLTLSEMQDEIRKEAQQRLASMIAPTWIVPVTTEVLTGSPALSIVEAARERGVSLIVMGTHGYSGLTRLVLGSVAERVVRTAPCPVLTVRHPEASALEKAAQLALSTAI
jgi:nucleotide-binding universal stress UspA family protein